MSIQAFYQENGPEVAARILDGVPEETTHFVYAYMAQSIDYLRQTANGFDVFYQGQWKVVAPFLLHSFKDITYRIEDLRKVAA